MPPFYSLPSSFLGGTAAAGGTALVSALGRVGAFLGPVIMGVLKESSGDYSSGMALLAGGQLLAACIVLGMSRHIGRRVKASINP